MKLDLSHIEHVAKLASLTLTREEAAAMTAELGDVLKYVDELASVDTSSVTPTASVQLGPTAWRSDVVAPGLSHEDALAQAPRQADGGFAVPGFVEGSS